MDAETLLEQRDQLCDRLDDQRRMVLSAHRAALSEAENSVLPFLMRMATSFLFRKSPAGFWSKAVMFGAPLVFGLVKKATASLAPRSGFVEHAFRIIPLVKTLFYRV